MSEKIAFIDLETTGLDPVNHEILEIGLVIVEEIETPDGITFEVLEEWETKVRPTRIETADTIAFKVNGYTPETWEHAVPLKEALEILSPKITLLTKSQWGSTLNAFRIGGHNNHLDIAFLTLGFVSVGIRHHFNKYNIDTGTYARAVFRHEPSGSYRLALAGLCEKFGIINEKAHTALSDARASFEVYKALRQYTSP